ncbi:ATP-grasp domain-containing protein [Eubacterium limosum]|uniref:ATP-binding protein n=1 Tax=Eubacterium limosum TaxID=1736 RepID=UPI0022E6FD5A|nr:ATP-grasp domain-containing protein [Eubacterium limosum]
MLKDHLFIVFAIEHYNPLGVIRSLGEAGIKSVFIAEKGRTQIASKSKYVEKCHYVDSVEEGYDILMKEYSHYEKNLPFVVTCDDRTAGFLDEHYEELKDKFIFHNAGETGRISKYMDKDEILQLAKKHGLKILNTQTVKLGEIPENLEYPIITKSISPTVGGWKSDVHICKCEQELVEAYKMIEAPTVLIQKYIEKKNEYCLDGFCASKGQIMYTAIASTYNYLIPGYYSPYMTVTNFEDNEMRKSLEGMMKEIGLEGIFSIEFLIDQDGAYYFSEINFRNSTWSYAATKAGMPLPVLWATAMLDGKMPEYKIIEDGFMAMVEPIDYAKRVKTGKIDKAQWMVDFKEAKCGFYYSADDLEPWKICVENWGMLG